MTTGPRTVTVYIVPYDAVDLARRGHALCGVTQCDYIRRPEAALVAAADNIAARIATALEGLAGAAEVVVLRSGMSPSP
jgi:hypothetical protein